MAGSSSWSCSSSSSCSCCGECSPVGGSRLPARLTDRLRRDVVVDVALVLPGMGDAAAVAGMPTSVDIGPFRYTITVDELTRQRAQEKSQCIVLGQTDHDKLEVIIDASAPISLLRETLMHETLHLVTEIAGLRYEWGEAKEETLIRRISPMLLEVLRRNPDVVAYLVAE